MNKQFDVVIGNPPYNKDMYLGFCENAFSLLKPDGVMVQITPANWQNAASKATLEALKHFRQHMVPHMTDTILYPNEKEIFDIALGDGITIWSANKTQRFVDKHKRVIENGEVLLDEIAPLYEGTDTTDKKAYIYISQTEQKLLERIRTAFVPLLSSTNNWQFKPQKPFYTSKMVSELAPDKVKERNAVAHVQHDSIIRLFGLEHTVSYGFNPAKLQTTEGLDQYKVITGSRTYQHPRFTWVLFGPNEIHGRTDMILGYGTKEQCESIASYYDSDLIWYLCKRYHNAKIAVNTFEHVPALPEGYTFDHIYTNEEIFNIFQLTPEERKLITSVIKERKKK